MLLFNKLRVIINTKGCDPVVPEFKSPNQKSEKTNMLNRKFGENLKAIRISKGYSQQQFAKIIGMSQAVVSSWEIGNSAPDFGNLFMLSNALRVPVTCLLPLEVTKNQDDIDRRILDIIHQDPRWELLFEKRKYLSDSDWDVVFSVLNAIVKERETNG